MHSLPVKETIARGWGFAGRRVLPLFGVGWLTAAFYGLVVAYFLTRLSGAMLVWPRPDAGGFDNFSLFYLFCLVVVTALANAAMAVPMTREALKPGGEWHSAFFVIARREWALFANLLLLYVIIIGIVSAIAFAGSVGIAVSLPLIGHDGVWQGISLAPIMRGVLTVVAIAVGLFLVTRFGFFLSPIAVAEPPARLLQAWHLSRGNFWRLLAIGLSVFVPIIVIALGVAWALSGSQFGDAAAALFSPTHDTASLFQMVQTHTGAIAAICAVALLVLNAIFAGASASAYGLVEHEAAPVSEGHVSMIEPAFAMAAASPRRAEADLHRVEPGFAPAEPIEPGTEEIGEKARDEVAHSPAGQSTDAAPIAQPAETTKAVEPVGEATAAEHASEAQTVEPPLLEHPPETVLDAAPAEEPLAAHKDEIPPMDPLGHAAPAAPDPTGAPVTPLPSFVKAQPSPKSGSSEAA